LRSLAGVKLIPGLYESPITAELDEALRALERLHSAREALTETSAPHVLARVVHDAALRALRAVGGDDALAAQVVLANQVLSLLGERSSHSGIDATEHVREPAELLVTVVDPSDARLGAAQLERPSLPLRHSDLLVNGPRDLRVGNEVRRELASADRVDLLVSFVKWSGFRLLEPELRRFLERRPGQLRVLTTTYMGASEEEAIEGLLGLGAQVKVSYDTRRTRLHAKAWLFHRDSGFSTGLVGSSNLSAAAMLDGCEWNVRLSNVDNAPILSKFVTTFEQYWADDEFEPYDRTRFIELSTRRDPNRDALARAVQLRPFPHQQAALDALEEERRAGHHRNLIVAATGSGKTVIAALDYARRCTEGRRPTLLFVAHRQEILTQSLATFRAALRDGHFGELLVGDDRPLHGQHVFASIQALHERRLARLAPDAYEHLVVDEFHHAEADTYRRLLETLKPRVLVGLTATPERTDGRDVLAWFDQRIAYELRLWDAIEKGLVVPFQYFGIHDGTDLSAIDFKAGRYDVSALERLYTADDVRARAVLNEVERKVPKTAGLKALGFCVSVKHAQYMAEFFSARGVPSVAVSGDSKEDERTTALRRLAAGELKVVFSRDLFNEGLDVPSVNTVLFLRPTESATVFLQQLGRGLRHEPGKACLTVLDFVGGARREFRFDQRFKALTRASTRREVERAVVEGFPHLPAGCEIRLDRETQRVVLENVRAHLGARTEQLRSDLRGLGDVSLPAFLEATGLSLEELYREGDASRVLTNLKRSLKLLPGDQLDFEPARALGRMLHVDDEARLDRWRSWLRTPAPPVVTAEDPWALMWFAVLGYVRQPVAELQARLSEVWAERDLIAELLALLELLADRRRRPTHALPGLPFRVHATYSRDEISAGLREVRKGKLLRTQAGVLESKANGADVFFVTLDKDDRHFTPTTLYRDYPISPTRFHWESQSITRADSPTGRRYRRAGQDPSWRTLLFVRQARHTATGVTAPYVFLGPVRYGSHEGEKPMQLIWELERAMPPDFFEAAKVAAG
jgi:superfamily II DNA or RNA helicase